MKKPLPTKTKEAKVCAILTADWHLSTQRPSARTDNWIESMSSAIEEIYHLHLQYDCPILIAGDLFHKWNEQPEAINPFLRWMKNEPEPFVYAIPGQHDLPYHSYKDVDKSSYWTLVQAEAIVDIPPGYSKEIHDPYPMRIHGFPYGFPLKPLEKPHDLLLEVALVHAYLWNDSTGYVNAPVESHVNESKKPSRGYDVIVYGDNHIPFERKLKDRIIFNCGSLMRRNIDQIAYKPSVGLLHTDGTIVRHYLKEGLGTFVEPTEGITSDFDWSRLKGELEQLSTGTLNFEELLHQAIEAAMSDLTSEVRSLILDSISKKFRKKNT